VVAMVADAATSAKRAPRPMVLKLVIAAIPVLFSL
jgi:hypothetical protein